MDKKYDKMSVAACLFGDLGHGRADPASRTATPDPRSLLDDAGGVIGDNPVQPQDGSVSQIAVVPKVFVVEAVHYSPKVATAIEATSSRIKARDHRVIRQRILQWFDGSKLSLCSFPRDGRGHDHRHGTGRRFRRFVCYEPTLYPEFQIPRRA